MRQHVAAALVIAAAAAAHADTPKPIDMRAAAAHVEVYRDEAGKLYTLPKEPGDDSERARTWTFYGDGRTMYLQSIVVFAAVSGDLTVGVWSPRVRGIPHAMIERKRDGTTSVICRMQRSKYERRPLTRVSDDDAAKLFQTATFAPPLWERRVVFVGRDGLVYYLVDALAQGEGLRLFVGAKGQMKPIALTDATHDTAGALLESKAGRLEIAPGATGAATWTRGKKRVAITRLDPARNAYLVYRELGAYGQLGTICEDQ